MPLSLPLRHFRRQLRRFMLIAATIATPRHAPAT